MFLFAYVIRRELIILRDTQVLVKQRKDLHSRSLINLRAELKTCVLPHVLVEFDRHRALVDTIDGALFNDDQLYLHVMNTSFHVKNGLQAINTTLAEHTSVIRDESFSQLQMFLLKHLAPALRMGFYPQSEAIGDMAQPEGEEPLPPVNIIYTLLVAHTMVLPFYAFVYQY